MRYLSIYRSVETGQPPTDEEMSRMGALIEKFMKTGELVGRRLARASHGPFHSTLVCSAAGHEAHFGAPVSGRTVVKTRRTTIPAAATAASVTRAC